MKIKLSTTVKNGYGQTCQSTSIAAEPPIHSQQIMTLIWKQGMNLMETKQHIINPKLEFCIGLLNWYGLVLLQNYHFWPRMLHSQERDTTDSVSYICLPEENGTTQDWQRIHPTLRLT